MDYIVSVIEGQTAELHQNIRERVLVILSLLACWYGGKTHSQELQDIRFSPRDYK